MNLCLFFLGYFPNGAALKFDVVSVDFSVCFLCFCVLGEGGGADCIPPAWNWIFLQVRHYGDSHVNN